MKLFFSLKLIHMKGNARMIKQKNTAMITIESSFNLFLLLNSVKMQIQNKLILNLFICY
jgi:hypothetical protein